MDVLETLFRQCEEQEAAFEREYADLYQGQAKPSAPQPSTSLGQRQTPPPVKPRREQARPTHRSQALFDEEDMQMYLLRQKYTQTKAVDEMERQRRVPIEPQSAWRDVLLVQYEEPELYLLIQTLLQKGKVTDELMQALQFQYQRKDSQDRFLRLFFTAWTAVQQEVSKQKMKQLIERLPSYADGTTEQVLSVMRVLLEYALEIIEETERLKEQGLRNRQEALEQALHKAESRYQAAHRDVLNHRW